MILLNEKLLNKKKWKHHLNRMMCCIHTKHAGMQSDEQDMYIKLCVYVHTSQQKQNYSISVCLIPVTVLLSEQCC